MSENLRWILCAVQDFDISVSRAMELIECDRAGEFTDDMMPADARSWHLFGPDDIPVQKYEALLAERDSLVAKLANKDENPTPNDLAAITLSQIDGLLRDKDEDISDDYVGVILFLLKPGLRRDTINRIHHSIVWGGIIEELRYTAKTFHNHDSLNERLRGVVDKFIKVKL